MIKTEQFIEIVRENKGFITLDLLNNNNLEYIFCEDAEDRIRNGENCESPSLYIKVDEGYVEIPYVSEFNIENEKLTCLMSTDEDFNIEDYQIYTREHLYSIFRNEQRKAIRAIKDKFANSSSSKIEEEVTLLRKKYASLLSEENNIFYIG